MIEKTLENLGFSQNMTTVYLFLIETGKAKAGDIISSTKLQRSVVYGVLDELLKRELISETTVRGVKNFSITDPAHILTELDRKKELAKTAITEIQKQQKQSPREVFVYEGEDALARIQEKNLRQKEGETIYQLGLSIKDFTGNEQKNIQQYEKRIGKKGLHLKTLFDRTTPNEIVLNNNNNNLESKYLPFESNMPVWFTIAGDELSIIIPDEEPLLAFHIKSHPASDGLKKYFNYLWQQEVKTYIGWSEIEKLFSEELLTNLKAGDKELVIGAGYGDSKSDKQVENLFLKHNTWLINHGVEKHALFYEKHRSRFENEIKTIGDPLFKLTKIKYLPDEFYSPVEFHIFDDKCTITYFGENPIATLYTNPGIINGFKKRFDFMWAMAKN